ncbi:hypothetical protein ABZ357_37910 [Streptomyces sp. NPDC005917]|uniref:hypothetical protein n=1 Tax=unclassified Streptomyces TaxID=2593676 RepID=UPI0033F0DB0C
MGDADDPLPVVLAESLSDGRADALTDGTPDEPPPALADVPADGPVERLPPPPADEPQAASTATPATTLHPTHHRIDASRPEPPVRLPACLAMPALRGRTGHGRLPVPHPVGGRAGAVVAGATPEHAVWPAESGYTLIAAVGTPRRADAHSAVAR